MVVEMNDDYSSGKIGNISEFYESDVIKLVLKQSFQVSEVSFLKL